MEAGILRLFPDGNTGIVFSSGGKLALNQSNINEKSYLPDAFIYGQIGNFKDIVCTGRISLFIIIFHPDGLNQLLNLPAAELRDRIISLSDIFGSRGAHLTEALFNCVSATEKINLAEDFFRQLLANRRLSLDPLIAASIAYIQKNKGLVTVNKLAHFTGYHERQVERRFNNVVGLSPKRFCNIVRLHAFLKKLKSNQAQTTITVSGYEAGYYDQAHLINQFKHITGITPSQYTGKCNQLAVNFLQLL